MPLMNNKLDILFLSSWYPNKIFSQNGNFVQQHARSVSLFCNVHALHILPREQQEKFVVENNTIHNVNETIVYYKKITSNFPVIASLTKLNVRRKAHQLGFQKIIEKSEKIDLVHLNVCFPAGMFALHLKKKLNIPYIITEHWTAFLKSSQKKFTFSEKYLIKKIAQTAAMICPVSENLKEAIIHFGIQNSFQVVPNVVNTDIFKANTIQDSHSKIGIFHLSNLKDDHKNITGILRVIKKLSTQRNDFKVTIAGNGDVEKFKQKAIDLTIPEEFIHFEGEKTPEEVSQLMSKNSLFLLFSNYENLPCVIAESLVMGVPVISTNVGGIPEMINPSNGVLASPKNEEELFEKLNSIIDNIADFDNTKIAKNAKKIYSYETVGKQFFDIYTQLLKN